MSIFGGAEGEGDAGSAPRLGATSRRPLPGCPPWDRITMLEHEKQVLGFHVSGHPLDQHEPLLGRYATARVREVPERPHEGIVVVGGLLSRVRLTVTRKGRSAGQRMAMISIQDKTGTIDGVVFSSVFAQCGQVLQTDQVVLVMGRVDLQQGEPQIIVEQVIPIDQAERQLTGTLEIEVPGEAPEAEQQLQLLTGLLESASANRSVGGGRPAEVVLQLRLDGRRVSVRSNRLRVVAEPILLGQLRELVGPNAVRTLSGGWTPPRREERRFARNGEGARQPVIVG